MSKPSIPKGTRDFLPEQSQKRQYIFDTLRNVFQLHGYMPIETPAIENLKTLTGKYGEEGDRLIYKILSPGDILDPIEDAIKLGGERKELESRLINKLSNRALRYDLTVPFARFVVQHQNDITFPFKRYQIQPVWRADRPQKGRYREFYQCDVDVIGSDSLLNEAELIAIIGDAFGKLGLPDVVIRLNNRKILSGIAEAAGIRDSFKDMTISIDKLDKIGLEGVKKEMLDRGLEENAIDKVLTLITLKGDPSAVLDELSNSFSGIKEGELGIKEMSEVFLGIPEELTSNVQIDLTLARGLDYYTGAIIEVGHKDFSGSICGGGRYDDLTGIFGLPDVSGVGVSFGADRIYDLMLDKNLFPDKVGNGTMMMFVNFGEKEAKYCLELLPKIRKAGISAELYPDAARMKKQMKYADSKGIKYVALVGSEEMNSGLITIKHMKSGEQRKLTIDQIIQFSPS